MSIQKDANKESNPSIVQLATVATTVIPESITNGSNVIKLVRVTQSHSNKVSPTSCIYEATGSICNITNPTHNTVHAIKTVSNNKVVKKIPVLKITINKKYNKPYTSASNKNKLSGVRKTNVCKAKENNSNKGIKADLKNDNQITYISPKLILLNVVTVVPEKSARHKNVPVETKNVYKPKTAYTRKGDLSRNNSHYQTSEERIRYLYTKAQRDCDILRIRLKALRERHIQEKEEVRRLRIHFGEDDVEECINEMSKRYSKNRHLSVSSESTDEDGKEEEEEYEKLLRKVRKIKQDISNPKHSIAASDKRSEQVNMQNHETVHGIYNNGTEVEC